MASLHPLPCWTTMPSMRTLTGCCVVRKAWPRSRTASGLCQQATGHGRFLIKLRLVDPKLSPRSLQPYLNHTTPWPTNASDNCAEGLLGCLKKTMRRQQTGGGGSGSDCLRTVNALSAAAQRSQFQPALGGTQELQAGIGERTGDYQPPRCLCSRQVFLALAGNG